MYALMDTSLSFKTSPSVLPRCWSERLIEETWDIVKLSHPAEYARRESEEVSRQLVAKAYIGGGLYLLANASRRRFHYVRSGEGGRMGRSGGGRRCMQRARRWAGCHGRKGQV